MRMCQCSHRSNGALPEMQPKFSGSLHGANEVRAPYGFAPFLARTHAESQEAGVVVRFRVREGSVFPKRPLMKRSIFFSMTLWLGDALTQPK
jgi:hypothetical protein